MLRRFALSVAAFSAFAAPLNAGADPSNAPSSFTITANCDGVPTTILVNTGKAAERGQRPFGPPSFIVGGGIAVPVAGAFTVTAPDGSIVFSDYPTKGNTAEAFAGKTTSCVFGETDAMGFTFRGELILVFKSQ